MKSPRLLLRGPPDWLTLRPRKAFRTEPAAREGIPGNPVHTVADPSKADKARQLAIVFGVLALLIPILTGIFNKGGDRVVMEAGPDSMVAISGPFSWRYFEWEIFGSNQYITGLALDMRQALGVDLSTAATLSKLINIANPTLFHLSLVFAIAALIAIRRYHAASAHAAAGVPSP